MNQNSNTNYNPFKNEITIKRGNTISSLTKKKLGSEKKEKEKNPKKEDKIEISDLYFLLKQGFEKLSIDINGLSTSILNLSNDIKYRDMQFGAILAGINSNITKIMSSNKISYSNES